MFRPKFNKDFIRKELLRQRQEIVHGIVDICHYVGEKFVKEARQAMSIDSGIFPKNDYTDRTGNLRQSIGYILILDGKVLFSRQPDNPEGMSYYNFLISSLPKAKGLWLVGMAGMKYASYVESMGYNVITSQSEMVFVDLSRMLKSYAESSGKRLSNTGGILNSML
ncbi:MAG TPA: hypothetical protein PLH91_03710 [Tenuifilaceae bacterium]|nr:hypothetical protein [Tenuifilaceae bacterium]HPI44314.1 hypothetical protein [Tenuifilaceae bacterium]